MVCFQLKVMRTTLICKTVFLKLFLFFRYRIMFSDKTNSITIPQSIGITRGSRYGGVVEYVGEGGREDRQR